VDPATPPSIVEGDNPCRKCQYNLRGLPVAGLCPECGTPIGLSIRGDLIRFSDPVWVNRLAWAAKLLLISLYATAAFFFIGVGVLRLTRRLDPLINACLYVAVNSIGYYATWILTTPDPSGLGEESYGTARRLARVAIFTALFNHILIYIQRVSAFPPVVNQSVDIIKSSLWCFSVVGVVATMEFIRGLMFRIPDDALADRAKSVRNGLGFAQLMWVAFEIFINYRNRMHLSPRGPSSMLMGLLALIDLILMLVFGIKYLLLLLRMSRRLRQEAVLAAQGWDSSAPAVA
jgi:hypothetical protein